MLKFVKKAFRNGLEIILWANFVFFIFGGLLIITFIKEGDLDVVYMIEENFGLSFLAILCGAVIGLIVNIILGGFIASILSIEKNTEELLKK